MNKKFPKKLNWFYEEILTPQKFSNLSDQELLNISSFNIIPAKLGKGNFGNIKVQYKTPRYSGPVDERKKTFLIEQINF